jgi:hypothetical protein
MGDSLANLVDASQAPEIAMRMARARFCEVDRKLSGAFAVASDVTLPHLMQQGNSRMSA